MDVFSNVLGGHFSLGNQKVADGIFNFNERRVYLLFFVSFGRRNRNNIRNRHNRLEIIPIAENRLLPGVEFRISEKGVCEIGG